MSAQVSEWPTGRQPALPSEANPYPAEPVYVPVTVARTDPDAIAQALAGAKGIDFGQLDAARAAGQRYADVQPGTPAPRGSEPFYLATYAEMTAPRPTFTPKPAARRLPVRVPGATLRAEEEASFAAFTPAPEPDLAPVPGWREGVVRGLLIAALWEACRWFGDMDGTGCGGCEALGGLCDWHAPKYERYWEYSDLHDFCVDAGWDAAALRAVVESVRAGKADVVDFASPGSHLDLILATALGTDRGAE